MVVTATAYFAISAYHETKGFDIPAVIFGGSAPAGQVAVRLTVDMAAQETISEDGVHVAGELFDEQWTPGYGTMFLSTASKYAYVANVDADATYAYKFLNGNDWGVDEWAGITAPSECTTDGNRTVEVASADAITEAVCYEGCSACAAPGQITLTVDMSNVTVQNGEVFAAGSFNGYSNEAMTDNGDGTYSLEKTLSQVHTNSNLKMVPMAGNLFQLLVKEKELLIVNL